MKLTSFTLTTALTLLGLSCSAVHAVTLTHLTSDDEMNALMQDIAFVAEGRIGDGSGVATHELNLHEFDPGDPQITEQFNWQNGVTENFELSYNPDLNLVQFTLGDRLLNYNYNDPFSDIFIRTRAVNLGSFMLIDNLSLDNQFLDDQSYAVAETGGLDILRISDVMNRFTLTGNSTMSWQDLPEQSQLAFQIKVAQTEIETPNQEIPEPSLIIGLLILAGVKISNRLSV
jgi:hypothetical protein